MGMGDIRRENGGRRKEERKKKFDGRNKKM
jgi:hypothetical protein